MREVLVYRSAEALAEGAASLLLDALNVHVVPPRFAIALSGGDTPKAIYHTMAKRQEASALFNEKVELFFSDERAVPPDHDQSNYGVARKYLLGPLSIRPEIVHRIQGEATDPAAEAARYEREIRGVVKAAANGIPCFDLVMLGMGEDGHTASLFPDSYHSVPAADLVVAPFVTAAGSYRISFNLSLINASRQVLFLVAGAKKAHMLKKVLCGEANAYIPPAAKVKAERTVWLLDAEAASQLDRRIVSVKEVS
ncbi:MAG: 6-phosphogluconolactonase [Candidatus Zixiibacteriota bacterium]